MPNAHARAQWARTHRSAERRARTAHRKPRPNAAIRVGLSAVIVASFLSAPDVTAPPPVEAACGTNHGSYVHPPRSIKVLRTRTGSVQNGGGSCYPDAKGISPNLPRAEQTRTRFFNTAAFVDRTLGPIIEHDRPNGVLPAGEQALIAIDPAHVRGNHQAKPQ